MKIILSILICSFILRIILFPLPGYKTDLSTFSAWFNAASVFGIRNFYNSIWSDYPPFNIYIFWFFGNIASALNLFGSKYLIYILKLAPTIFDIGLAFLIFKFVRKKSNFKIAIFSASFYTFNVATIFNTSVWGQYDAIYTFFLILSLIFYMDSKINFSIIFYSIAILTKPQSIALAPLMLFLILQEDSFKKIAKSILIFVFTIFIIIIPFNWSNPLEFLSNIYFGGYSNYGFTSINAFNIWAFQGFWKPDTINYFLFINPFIIGWIMFGLLTFVTLYKLNKEYSLSKIDNEFKILFAAFILLFGFFMLPTRIHERYLFPVFSILALILPFFRKIKLIFGILSFTYFINQAYVLYYLNQDRFIPDYDPIVLIITVINIVFFLYSLIFFYKNIGKKENFKSD